MGMFSSIKDTVVATRIVAADGSGQFTNIQNAIDALPAAGGVVYIKEGTYTISSAITINKDNVALVGAGKSTKITTDGYISLITCSNQSGIHIEKVWLMGGPITLDVENNITFDTVLDSTIIDCWIENASFKGISLINSENITIRGNFIYSNQQGENISIDGDCVKIFFADNLVWNSVWSGVGIWGGEAFVTNNGFHNNGRSGVALNHASNSVIEGNIFDGNNTSNEDYHGGIYDMGSNDIVINDNRFKDNNLHAIYLFGNDCYRTIIVGNNCNSPNGSDEIHVEGSGHEVAHNVATIS